MIYLKCMTKNKINPEVAELQDIEHELKEIKGRMMGPKRALINGVMQGMGAVIGSIAAVAFIGWLLYIFGFIPVFDELAEYIKGLMSAR